MKIVALVTVDPALGAAEDNVLLGVLVGSRDVGLTVGTLRGDFVVVLILGEQDGSLVELTEGDALGHGVSISEGRQDGMDEDRAPVGAVVGRTVGKKNGFLVGPIDGAALGKLEGTFVDVGILLGSLVGLRLSEDDGSVVDLTDSDRLG